MPNQPDNGLNVSKTVLDVMGNDLKCLDLRDGGITCINPTKERLYQATEAGTSVSKINVDRPKKFDFDLESGIKVKVIDDNCRISTSNFGKSDEINILMCYKNNDDPDLLDIGENMQEMDEKLEKLIKKI